jgi:hypothetical protein
MHGAPVSTCGTKKCAWVRRLVLNSARCIVARCMATGCISHVVRRMPHAACCMHSAFCKRVWSVGKERGLGFGAHARDSAHSVTSAAARHCTGAASAHRPAPRR